MTLPAQKQQIERLSRRRVPPRQIVSHDLAREITGMSRQLNRRIGLLVDRSGRIEAVSVGDAHTLGVPRKPSAPSGRMRFCTLRFVATRFADEDLPSEELAPLALHRLDALAVIAVGVDGLPGPVRVAHLLPDARVETLHSGIQRVLGDPVERERMSREGPVRAADYAWSIVARRYVELMVQMVA